MGSSARNTLLSRVILALVVIFAYAVLFSPEGTLGFFVVQFNTKKPFPILLLSSDNKKEKEKRISYSSTTNSSIRSILWAMESSNNNNNNINHNKPRNRRDILVHALAAGFVAPTLLGSSNNVAMAAISSRTSASEMADKEKLIKGYQRLSYLLQNWDQETTVCGKKNDGIVWEECDRSPEKVMEYLGFKSMNDPLFKADKAIKRLQTLIPEENDDEYQEAYQSWIQHAEEGKDMAYVSSWGEANPGGGLDVKASYIERSRKEVEEARQSLATIIRLLGLKVVV